MGHQNVDVILVPVLVALIGILGAIYIHRRNARREAGKKLIDAFAEELATLDPYIGDKSVNIDAYLRAAIKKQKIAVDNFRHHLYFWERSRFNKAWIAYYGEGDERCQSYLQYMEFGSNPDARSIFREKVNAILKFANQK